MPEKFTHPDKQMAMKYMVAAIILLTLDYFVPYIGVISIVLMFIALKQFMHAENTHFKRAYSSLIKMTIAYIIMRLSIFIPNTGLFTVRTDVVVALIAMGISTIYFNYVTHFFTEGILLDAKTAKVNFRKLGLNAPWIIFGVCLMLHFVCKVTFVQPIPSIIGVFAICTSVYYCMKLLQAAPIVYLPRK